LTERSDVDCTGVPKEAVPLREIRTLLSMANIEPKPLPADERQKGYSEGFLRY